MNIDSIMKELAEYIRMQEEAAAMVESLKDQLKERMTAAGVDSLAGSEHKATYKAVTSSRVDTTRLKKGSPGDCSPLHQDDNRPAVYFRLTCSGVCATIAM